MTKSQAKKAALPIASRQPHRLLSPRFTLPILGISTAAVIVLAVLLALGVNGQRGQSLTVTTCQAGTAGCELRSATHLHANFALVIRGHQFDFNQRSLLSEEGNDRSASAHLHVPRFGVVHVHRTGTSWDEFLRSIGFELSDPSLAGISARKSCLKLPDGQKLCESDSETFKFYVNGIKVDGISLTNISDLDRVLISFGTESQEIVTKQQVPLIGDDACIPSERCVDRIPKDEPPEPCTKSNDTCVKPGG